MFPLKSPSIQKPYQTSWELAQQMLDSTGASVNFSTVRRPLLKNVLREYVGLYLKKPLLRRTNREKGSIMPDWRKLRCCRIHRWSKVQDFRLKDWKPNSSIGYMHDERKFVLQQDCDILNILVKGSSAVFGNKRTVGSFTNARLAGTMSWP